MSALQIATRNCFPRIMRRGRGRGRTTVFAVAKAGIKRAVLHVLASPWRKFLILLLFNLCKLLTQRADTKFS